MIGNYWNSAYRNLMKRKGFSFINVFGLAVGMASALLILTYVTFEFSFDKMHQKYECIFRVESTFYEGEVQTDYWASSSFGYGSAMKENLAGIEDYTRVVSLYQPEQIVKYGELTLRENQIAYADPGFFRLFDFELVKGDKATCLSMPRQVVITERIARKYFQDEDPIGKILIFTGPYDKVVCEVTGVMKEMPSNSHIHYNFLISYKSLGQYLHDYWYKHEVYTYVLLDSPERKEEIEKAFPAMSEKYKTDEALKNKIWGVSLTPLADIHLKPQVGYEAEIKGNRTAMIALIFAAIAILAIAWINYILGHEPGCIGTGSGTDRVDLAILQSVGKPYGNFLRLADGILVAFAFDRICRGNFPLRLLSCIGASQPETDYVAEGKVPEQQVGRRHSQSIGSRSVHGIYDSALRHIDCVCAVELHAQSVAGSEDGPDSGCQISRTDRRHEHETRSHEEGHCPPAFGR